MRRFYWPLQQQSVRLFGKTLISQHLPPFQYSTEYLPISPHPSPSSRLVIEFHGDWPEKIKKSNATLWGSVPWTKIATVIATVTFLWSRRPFEELKTEPKAQLLLSLPSSSDRLGGAPHTLSSFQSLTHLLPTPAPGQDCVQHWGENDTYLHLVWYYSISSPRLVSCPCAFQLSKLSLKQSVSLKSSDKVTGPIYNVRHVEKMFHGAQTGSGSTWEWQKKWLC